MEQLVWAIILIVIIIFTALKNRARNRPNTNIDSTSKTDQKAERKTDRLSTYMEELLGIDKVEATPQRRIRRETPKPLQERVVQREEPEIKNEADPLGSPLVKDFSEKWTSPLPEGNEICHAKFPWGTLMKRDIPNAIILSEIIGPPISKRKGHRLF